MTSRSKPTKFLFSPSERVTVGLETSLTRRRIQDVLGQARATLRQSQQFRSVPEAKDNALSAKLQFTQKANEDFWSTPNAAAVETRPERPSEDDDSLTPSSHSKPLKSDSFSTPFRSEARKGLGPLSRPAHKPASPRIPDYMDEFASDSSSSLSLCTADLKITSESSDSEASVVSSHIAKSSTKKPVTPKKSTNWKDPVARVLTPLTPTNAAGKPLTPAIPPGMTLAAAIPSGKPLPDQAIGSIENPSLTNTVDPEEFDDVPKPQKRSGVIAVGPDDMGFMRAQVTDNNDDPHWFEKALLARGELISEAAYNAFKESQINQIQQKEEDIINKNVTDALATTKGQSQFKNVNEPEYTADWGSDLGGAVSVSDMDLPQSEYVEDTFKSHHTHTESAPENPITEDEVDESMIKTATELDENGVLDSIVENLHSVLEISDYPASINLSGLTPEERSFAKEYDEAMENDDEPLQSIFLESEVDDKGRSKVSEYSQSSSTIKNERRPTKSSISQLKSSQNEAKSSASIQRSSRRNQNDPKSSASIQRSGRRGSKSSQRVRIPSPDDAGGDKNYKEEEYGYTEDEFDDYDSSFIHMDSTDKSELSKTGDSKSGTKSMLFSDRKSLSKASMKKSTSEVKNARSKQISGSMSSNSKNGNLSTKSKSKSKTVTSSSSTSRRLQALPIPLDPPTSRHQKSIQNILEKEVYQKEVKRIRSEKIREEKTREALKKKASKAKERNLQQTYKDPDYTEILLPDLFKYKSVSGLNAAKAKRSILPPQAVNYGAPYFTLSGALSAEEGTDAMLAAARVETLDIPDLVREVLASNERMYKMTVEASEQLANKAYRAKAKKEMSRQQR